MNDNLEKFKSKKRSEKLEFFIGAVLFLACLGGFLWHVYDSVQKYVQKKTTVATDWALENVDSIKPSLRLPAIVFCDSRGFYEKQRRK